MSPLRCAACRASVRRAGAVFCAACLAPHHVTCFVAGDRCAAAGCSERFVVRPGRVRQRVRPGLLALGLVAIAVAAALRSGSDAALSLDDEGATAVRLEREALRREVRAEAAELLAARVERARELLDEPRRLLDARLVAAPEVAGVLAGAAIEDARRVLAGEPELTAMDDAALALDREIEALFVEIVRLCEERQVEELIQRFARLRELMNEATGRPGYERRLERWNQRLSELGEGSLSFKLQVFISQGNQCLRHMADGIRADDYPRVEAVYAAALTVCAEMRLEEREVYHRNADALELRARTLVDRGRDVRRQLRQQQR